MTIRINTIGRPPPIVFDGWSDSDAASFALAAYGEMLAVHGADGVAVPLTAALTSLGYSGEHFDAKAQQQYLRARWYDPANGRFNRLDPFAGNMQDPQSLHEYAYVHGDPILHIDPSGKFFTTVGAMVSSSVRLVMNNKQVVAGLYVLDKASTLADVMKAISLLVAGGAVPPGLVAGLLVSMIPFGSVLKRAKPIFDGGVDAVGFLRRGGAGYLDNATEAMSDIYRSLRGTGGLAGRKLTQTAGETSAALTAKKLGLEAVESFPIRYRGIDGLYKNGDKIVIVEAKGYARGTTATLSATQNGQQLSRQWIEHQSRKLRARGYALEADMLDDAMANGKIQAMVVKTEVDDVAEEVTKVGFELKDWANIGQDRF